MLLVEEPHPVVGERDLLARLFDLATTREAIRVLDDHHVGTGRGRNERDAEESEKSYGDGGAANARSATRPPAVGLHEPRLSQRKPIEVGAIGPRRSGTKPARGVRHKADADDAMLILARTRSRRRASGRFPR
jgi:hypothetical protein